MHPIVPVVDEAQFWRVYKGGAGTVKVSLFLLQAILFASCVVSHLSGTIYALRFLLTYFQVRVPGYSTSMRL